MSLWGSRFRSPPGTAPRLLLVRYDNGTLPLRTVSRYPSSLAPTASLQRLHPCSSSWSSKLESASCSRRSHSACSARDNRRRRVRYCPRVRTSINSISSLSCSMQDRTASCFWGIAYLLKTDRHTVPRRRTKSKRYFRLLFAPGPQSPLSPFLYLPTTRAQSSFVSFDTPS